MKKTIIANSQAKVIKSDF